MLLHVLTTVAATRLKQLNHQLCLCADGAGLETAVILAASKHTMAPPRRSGSGAAGNLNAAGGAGGYDEAFKLNQQLKFCQQLHSLQQQLCAETFLSDELLGSLYALSQFCATPACALQQITAAYPEVSASERASLAGPKQQRSSLNNNSGRKLTHAVACVMLCVSQHHTPPSVCCQGAALRQAASPQGDAH